MNIYKATYAVAAFGSLAACSIETVTFEGVRRYQGPESYIAVAADVGQGTAGNTNDRAGIAVTPDGCQAWVIDDGIEGRASNRLDPVSGLPVCAGEPGVVYGDYQSGESEIADRVPRNPANVVNETVEILPTTGHAHVVHDVSEHHH